MSRNEVAPEEYKTKSNTNHAHLFSPCYFSADSRSHPECMPHRELTKECIRFQLRLSLSSSRTLRLRLDDMYLMWTFSELAHEFREWKTAGELPPINSALIRPYGCIRRALRCVWATSTPVRLATRSLPRKMRPEQQQPRTFIFLPVFFLQIPVLLPNAPPIVKQ